MSCDTEHCWDGKAQTEGSNLSQDTKEVTGTAEEQEKQMQVQHQEKQQQRGYLKKKLEKTVSLAKTKSAQLLKPETEEDHDVQMWHSPLCGAHEDYSTLCNTVADGLVLTFALQLLEQTNQRPRHVDRVRSPTLLSDSSSHHTHTAAAPVAVTWLLSSQYANGRRLSNEPLLVAALERHLQAHHPTWTLRAVDPQSMPYARSASHSARTLPAHKVHALDSRMSACTVRAAGTLPRRGSSQTRPCSSRSSPRRSMAADCSHAARSCSSCTATAPSRRSRRSRRA